MDFMTKKITALLLGVTFPLVSLLAVANAEAARQIIVVGTAPAGTSSFAYMVGLSSIVNKNVKDLALSPQETGGSVANIRLLDEGKIGLSGFSSMVAADAVEGRHPFKKKRRVRVLFSMYPQRYLWFARKASGAKSWDQLAGKSIIVGSAGGGTRVVGTLVARAKSLVGKSKINYLRPGAMINALRDGTADAGYGVVAGTQPAPWVREVVTTLDVRLFGLDEAAIAQISKKKAGLFKNRFPDGFFKGSKGFSTLSDYLLLGATARMDARTVYLITKSVQENLGRLPRYSPVARGIRAEDALRGIPGNVSLHAGAARYLKEKGLLK